jgi:hypothetical protein
MTFSRGFADFTRYATPDGLTRIALRPQGLLACIRFRGLEPRGTNVDVLNDYEQRFARILEHKSIEWCFHISQRRASNVTYPTTGAWPSPVVRALDYVREQNYTAEGQHLPTVHHLWVAYHPNTKQRRLLNELAGNYTNDTGSITEYFEGEVRTIIDALSGIAYDVERLSGHFEDVGRQQVLVSDLISALKSEIDLTDGLIAVDELEPMFLDGILAPDSISAKKSMIEFNGDELIVATIWGYPNYATSALFMAFGKLSVPSRFTMRIIPLTSSQGEAAWNNRSRRFLLGTLDLSLFFPRNGQEGAEGPRQLRAGAERERNRAQEGTSFATVLAVVVARCSNEQQAARIRKDLATIADTLYLRISIENPAAGISAYIGSLPGEPDRHALRRAIMSTSAAIKLSPVLSTWHGPEKHPNRKYPSIEPILMLSTPEREPFRLYHHDGEVGHAVIYGKTGEGKSVLLRALENGHLSRYKNGEILTLDIGYSAIKYARSIHATHMVADRAHRRQFAFLAGIDNETRHPAIVDDLRELAELWLGKEISVSQYNAIAQAIARMQHVERDLVHLSALGTYIQDMDLRDLFNTFQDSFLDGWKDPLDFSTAVPYWCIEYGSLGLDNPRWTAPFIAHVQRRLWETCEQRPGRMRLAIFDEGARAMKSSRIADFKERQDREGRKHNISSIFATQTPKEIVESPIGDVIISQAATRFSYRNPAAKRGKMRQYHLDVGFTEEQTDIIATELQKHEFLVASDKGHQIVKLLPTDMELAIYGGASDEDRELVESLYERYGPQWLPHYFDSANTPESLSNYSEGIRALETVNA